MEETYACHECESKVKPFHRFCFNCGAFLRTDAEQISIFNNSNLQTAFFFYVIYLFVCLTVKYTNWFSSYDQLFWIEILLAAVTVYFAKINFKSLKPVLRFNNFNLFTLLGVIVAGVIFSSVVNVFITEINISFFGTNYNLYE
jgi:cation transport ATPase